MCHIPYTLHLCCLLACYLLLWPQQERLGSRLYCSRGAGYIEQQAWVAIAFWLRSCFSELLLPTAALQWLVCCGF